MRYLFLAVAVHGLGFSALSPLSQSLREYDTILTFPTLSDHISQGEIISEMIKVEGGYLIITNKQVVKVDVIFTERKTIGPAKFSLRFSKAIKLEQ
jgi:hypothetical protein